MVSQQLPRLVIKESKTHNYYEGLQKICRLVDMPVCVGGLSVEEEAMVKEGKEVAEIHPNIVVKCPLTSDGLKATRRLTAEGIRVIVTLCSSPAHALLAADAGAWCVSSFIGCLGNMRSREVDMVRQIVTMFRHNEISTQVFVAGIQDVRHVAGATMAGSHICGISFSVMKKLIASRSFATDVTSVSLSRVIELIKNKPFNMFQDRWVLPQFPTPATFFLDG